MSKNVLISLVSEQTLPNVELIKEFSEFIDQHLFVHTSQTQNELKWITKSAKIEEYQTLEVKAFDIADIEEKLKTYDFQDDQYYLNITGGTKVMILTFQEFFKNLGARIYYVTGQNCEYIKIFPIIGERKFQFKSRLTLEEYLFAYGFEFKKSNPMKDVDQLKNLMSFFLDNDMKLYSSQIELIRAKRGKKLTYNEDSDIKQFLDAIGFLPFESGTLNKYETKCLSGDWFEEYVYFKIKEELDLSDDEIGTGYNLTKQNTPNEIDVIFVYKHRLYIIECKTSVIDIRLMPNNEVKEFKLLPEIIYKSDALRSKFGLHAHTSILTLEEIKEDDGTPKEGYKTHFERAELSRINILSKMDFASGNSISDLLKIQ
jgi:hypothetical protein